MIFNSHSNLVGQHAFLSASKYHWINYDEEKLERIFRSSMAAQRGTELHAFAHEAIRLKIKLPTSKKTLCMYVNDALGYGMTPEQMLYYSDNCYGTADTIGFRRNKLRIHDLKTGANPSSMKQLEVYDALFCLEYNFKPFEISHELRIYQNDEVYIHEPNPEDIVYIMDKIMTFDKRISVLRMEEPS